MKGLGQCHDIAKELDRLANGSEDEVLEHGGRLFLDAINAGCFDSTIGDPDFKAVVDRVKRDRLRPDDAWRQAQLWFELIGFNRTRYPLDAPASEFKSFPSIELLCARLAEIIEQAAQSQQQRAGKPKRNRLRSRPRKTRPLTVRQTETIQIVGECKGNIAQAAKRLGKDRKTVEESYRAGMTKLGKTVVQSRDKTRLFARDERGQEVVSTDDDRRL